MGKGAHSSGSGGSSRKAKDQAQAAYMQKHPGQFPDSIMRQNTPRVGTPALAFSVQPARGGPIPHHNPRMGTQKRRDAA